MTNFKKIECIEIRLIDGVHFAFYKGEKLPFLIESTINQTAEGYSVCELKFECKMEEGQHPYEILSEYYRNQKN